MVPTCRTGRKYLNYERRLRLLGTCQAHFLRTYYPDLDVPTELIREQIATEARLDDSLHAFDPLLGDLVTSLSVPAGSKKWRTFMAFPMGESGCDLSRVHSVYPRRKSNASPDFSGIEFSAEGTIITEPTHSPVRTFKTPICQIVPSPMSDDPDRGNFCALTNRQR